MTLFETACIYSLAALLFGSHVAAFCELKCAAFATHISKCTVAGVPRVNMLKIYLNISRCDDTSPKF